MIKNYVTIFTPTYNRAQLLKKLYESLLKQDDNRFEWVVVDDGSIDNTEEVMKGFVKEKIIKIKYLKQVNSGKHIAINYGLDNSIGELFFIVDSDDYLIPSAIHKILNYWTDIINKEKYAGIAGLKGYDKNNSCTKGYGEKKFLDCNSIELAYKYKINGDKAEVFKTELLKRYKFPYIEGTKFITEGTIWLQIANDGFKIRWFNEIIYIAEYRSDGLTKNSFKLHIDNWKSSLYSNNMFVSFKKIPVKNRILYCSNYYKYGLIGKKNIITLFKESNSKIISLLGIPIGILRLIYLYMKLHVLYMNR